MSIAFSYETAKPAKSQFTLKPIQVEEIRVEEKQLSASVEALTAEVTVQQKIESVQNADEHEVKGAFRPEELKSEVMSEQFDKKIHSSRLSSRNYQKQVDVTQPGLHMTKTSFSPMQIGA